MAETYTWTSSYHDALQQTDDQGMIDATWEVTVLLIERKSGVGVPMSDNEQQALLTAASDMHVLRATCLNRKYPDESRRF